MKKKLYTFYLLICLSIISCNSADDGPNSGKDFDRSIMLENFTTNLIIPSYSNFNSQAEILLAASNTFDESVTEANLAALQEAWKKTAEAWNSTQAFNYVGPAYDSSFIIRINKYPSDKIKIEDHISSSSEINSAFIESLGGGEKGLPAVEYLIFSQEGNSVILNKFLTEGENRKTYLKALTENIKEKAANLEAGWQPSGKSYTEAFLSKTGTDAGSSTNLLANSIIQAVEDIKNIKIGEPIGKKGGSLQPEKVEAFNSEYSIDLIKTDLNAIENAFKGGEGAGFDDYLNKIDAKWQDDQLLSDRIIQQFESIRTALDELDNPLNKAVTAETAEVDKLFNSFTSLVSLLKGEMISRLGLSVTYSDNDGD